MGKSKENELMMNENRDSALEDIGNWHGRPFDPLGLSEHFISRCLISSLTGSRSAYTNRVQQLVLNVSNSLSYFANPGNSLFLEFIPQLRWLPFGVGKRYKQMMREKTELRDVLLSAVKIIQYMQRVKNLDAMNIVYASVRASGRSTLVSGTASAEKDGLNEDTMLYRFLKQARKEESSGFDIGFTMESVTDIIVDLCAGGVQTPVSLLYSLIYAVAYRQDVQKKIQDEVEHSIGSSRGPTASDKHCLPYSEATVMEAARMATPLRLLGPIHVLSDVESNGYLIPKNTKVLKNLWEPTHTEDYWERPNEFDPTRFLDEKGQIHPPNHETMKRIFSFGNGKRECPGRAFSLTWIHVIIVSILQRYHLTLDKESTDDLTTVFYAPYNGIVFRAPPYKILATARE